MEYNNGRMQFGFRNEAKEKTITDEQFSRYLKAIPFVEDHRLIEFWENVYYCAAYLGLRSIETCHVRVEDIDFVEKTLTLPTQKNKERFEKIIIPDFMINRFKQHLISYKSQIILNGTNNSHAQSQLRGDYYIFWRMRSSRGKCQEKCLSTKTIRAHLKRTRIQAGLDMKYGMTKDGHTLSILSYHTLRHYYLQKICDQRGVFAAQISGRHKNLRSTERYLTTSLTAKKDIVNDVFNNVAEKETNQISSLKDEIAELKNLMRNSMVLSNGSSSNIKNQNRISIEESEKRMQNEALYQARQIKKTIHVEETEEMVGHSRF